MFRKKNFFLFFFLFVFIQCLWLNKNTDKKFFYKLVFHLNENSGKVCLFRTENLEPTGCSSDYAFENSCKTFYFSDSNSNLEKSKTIQAEFFKILSELELNYPKIKSSLTSVFIIGFEKDYFKKEKDFQKELEASLKKYKVNLHILFFKEEDELKIYSENIEQSSFLFHTMKERESRFFIRTFQPNKDLFFKEEITPFTIAKKNEDKKEFIACRQALSEKIRSTGKTGIENALKCQEIIFDEMKKSKTYSNLQKEIRERQISKIYLQEEDWNLAQEILNSSNLVYSKLLEKQVDFCYLSPMELIKKYKISKKLAKSACYYFEFAISFLDFLNINEAQVIQEDEFLRQLSIHPQIDSKCNPNPPPAKKKS
ncbi:MAG: hypothetical protein N3A69_01230 [Leptospiraceae bacterium]|nr:hypothetical protein [Leptospiraceae bacterium]